MLVRDLVRIEWNREPIKPESWGKDHISTLLYVESVIVDSGGKPDHRKMRCKPDSPLRQSELADLDTPIGCPVYPTRLKGGVELFNHDDWDCVDDFIAAGMLINKGTGLHPIYMLTDYGWKVAGALRRARAEGRRVSDIVIPPKD